MLHLSERRDVVDTVRPGRRGYVGRSRRRVLALTATCASTVVVVAGLLAVAPDTPVAGASTTSVAASWSSGPNCSTWVTATPPPGTVSATVTVNGGGGGGGATNSGSGGTGGTGGQVSGTFSLTHTTGTVSVKLGCGGSGGSTGGGHATVGGASGGSGFAPGGSSGSAASELASVDGESTGGGGGAATGLCLGSGTCTTPVVVAAGGGGGGARWDCTGSTGPGSGGAASGTTGGAGTNGDGSSGGGGGGGTPTAGGSGGSGYTHAGGTGGNTPPSSGGGGGGSAGSTGAFGNEAAASGAGGGGGYTGGGGGGGDDCATGSSASGGGGAGSSYANATYGSASYGAGGGAGGGTGATGGIGSISLSWNVDNLSVSNPGTQSNTSGSAIPTLSISAPHDTTGGNSVTFSASNLPAGLSINPASGAITGTPTTAGTSTVTVTAQDSQSLTASTTFTWNVSNTVTVPNPGTQNSVSGSAITPLTVGGTDSSPSATLSYSATGLPAGLSVDSSTGTVSGTPTTAGTASVTINATDGSGYSGSATFTWNVTNSVSVHSPGAQSDVSGTAISPVTTGGTDSSSTTTLSYSATGLPAGLSINPSSGTITGTPTTAGTSSVTVTATDGAGYSGSSSFSWVISNTVAVSNPGAQSDVSGSAIAELDISASDTSSTTNLSYSDGGTLPAGLSIDSSTGAITGTPTTAGVANVTVTVTDGASYTAATTFTWTVTNTVSVTGPGDQSDTSGSAISPVPVTGTDSSSTTTLTYSATGLPNGLSIDASSGTIAGTPTVAGTFPVTVTAIDGAGFSSQVSFTWTITNTVSVVNPGAQSSVSGSTIPPVALDASDSVPTATLSYADGGTLPAGLAIDPATGIISGTPQHAGTSTVTITVTDDADFAAQVTFSWTVSNVVDVTSPSDQSSGSGAPVTPLTVGATDSDPSQTLTYGATGLPAGLTIDPSSGTVSGTPTTAGASSVTVTATDGAGFAGSASFTWTVGNTVSVTGPGDQSDTSGSAITPVPMSSTDSSSTTSVTYSSTGLPAGLSIASSTGTISGTPTTAGTSSVTVTATDGAGFSGSTSFSWTITNTVTLATPADQSSTLGAAITPVALHATDTSSTATIGYSDGGTLPPGLSVGAGGVITGSATHSGVFAVTVTATDDAGFSASATFTWTVQGPTITALSKSSGGLGAKVKVTGTGLTGATGVTFGGAPGTVLTVNKKGTKAVVVAPSHAGGTVDVIVTTPQGPTLATPADRFTYLSPYVTKLSKHSGPAAGGTTLKVVGTNLAGATSVTFGGVPATISSVNGPGTDITVVSPPGTGTVDVVVTTAEGTSITTTADLFTYQG